MPKKQHNPQEEFDKYYAQIYKERWEKLKESINAEHNYYTIKASDRPYHIDTASLYPVLALAIEKDNKILDLCAAPGGKTLLIAKKLSGTGKLIANEKSQARKTRLDKVLTEHLPQELRKNIITTCKDASTWGLYEQNKYDKILADVPCSSEAHLIKNPKELKKWTKNRSKSLAIKQYAILASGFMALAKGGYIVYSTCALSPMENDKIIEKLIKRHGDKLEITDFAEHTQIPDEAKLKQIEKTQYGYHILPDKNNGAGPIYFSIIKKTQETLPPGKNKQ